MEKTARIPFDKFHIPVPVSAIKTLILDEIKTLSAKTGHPGDHLPVEFYSATDVNEKHVFIDNPNTLACFVYTHSANGNITPKGFFFSLEWMTQISAHQIIDVVKHEFAHYIRTVKYGVSPIPGGHDQLWREICVKIGYPPEQYHMRHNTQILFY